LIVWPHQVIRSNSQQLRCRLALLAHIPWLLLSLLLQPLVLLVCVGLSLHQAYAAAAL
jgi:hypothetical protein